MRAIRVSSLAPLQRRCVEIFTTTTVNVFDASSDPHAKHESNVAKMKVPLDEAGTAMAIYALGDYRPDVPDTAYVAEAATVIGRVTLGDRASVWPGAVIRADDDTITIGARTNVQDGAVLHVDPGLPLAIGADVTVGHLATLHGCTIGDGTLIGLGAIVYNRAVIGRDCLVGAGTIVTEGKTFPDRSLIVGAPARLVRELDDAAIAAMRRNVDAYVQRGAHYRTSLKRIG